METWEVRTCTCTTYSECVSGVAHNTKTILCSRVCVHALCTSRNILSYKLF